MELAENLTIYSNQMLGAYVPAYKSIPLRLGFCFKPIWSSTPNTYKNPLLEAVGVDRSFWSRKLSVWHTLPVEATALLTLYSPEDLREIAEFWFSDRVHYVDSCFDNPIQRDHNGALGFGWLINSLILPAQTVWWDSMKTRPEAGRFGVKLEGSGKVRVFAIANPVFQALLRPLHDWVMECLRTLKTDGTFHQTAPLERHQGKTNLYSFDLKAATDSLPVDLSGSMLSGLLGRDFAQSWVYIMTSPGFRTPGGSHVGTSKHVYRFKKGQPLGYYSSWPVFALTHHMLVWWAAWSVYPGKRFFDYAILGDDIVIADDKVAAKYAELIEDCEVSISKEKSLISKSGAMEFAKRFLTDRGMTDLSPVSVRK